MIRFSELKNIAREARDADEMTVKFRALARNKGELSPRNALRHARKLGFRKETTLRFVDALTLCHGVEAFESIGGFYEYANAGDSYVETVILYPSGAFRVTDLGTVLERASHQRWAEKHA